MRKGSTLETNEKAKRRETWELGARARHVLALTSSPHPVSHKQTHNLLPTWKIFQWQTVVYPGCYFLNKNNDHLLALDNVVGMIYIITASDKLLLQPHFTNEETKAKKGEKHGQTFQLIGGRTGIQSLALRLQSLRLSLWLLLFKTVSV